MAPEAGAKGTDRSQGLSRLSCRWLGGAAGDYQVHARPGAPTFAPHPGHGPHDPRGKGRNRLAHTPRAALPCSKGAPSATGDEGSWQSEPQRQGASAQHGQGTGIGLRLCHTAGSATAVSPRLRPKTRASAAGPTGNNRATLALGRPTGAFYSRRAARTIWWPPVAETRVSSRPSERATSAEIVARLAPV